MNLTNAIFAKPAFVRSAWSINYNRQMNVQYAPKQCNPKKLTLISCSSWKTWFSNATIVTTQRYSNMMTFWRCTHQNAIRSPKWNAHSDAKQYLKIKYLGTSTSTSVSASSSDARAAAKSSCERMSTFTARIFAHIRWLNVWSATEKWWGKTWRSTVQITVQNRGTSVKSAAWLWSEKIENSIQSSAWKKKLAARGARKW